MESLAFNPLSSARLALLADGITKESETEAVAAWVKELGLQGAVVGAWVWVDSGCYNEAQAGGSEALAALLKLAGFQYSRRRARYYHQWTVEPRKDRRPGGKLERFHNAVTVGEFNPRTYDARPAWRQAKDRKKTARRKRA